MKHHASTPLHKITLYQFKGFDMGEFIKQYLYIITPHETIDENTLSVYKPAEMKMSEARRGAKDENIITCKCMYLQDAIVRRAYAKADSQTFSLSSTILKEVIGDDYKPMLEVLEEMGYIVMGDGNGGADNRWYYQPMVSAMRYTLLDVEVEQITILNLKIQTYKEETKRRVEVHNEEALANVVDKSFIKKYITSLKYIRIADYEGLRAYISNAILNKPKSNLYYDFVVKSLEDKDRRIHSIDSCHRFYHVLTNLDRNIKKYLTIDYMLDAKNSHPLLFNHYVFDKHHIDKYSSYLLSKWYIDTYNNILNNNKLNKEYTSFSDKGEISNFPYYSVLHNVAKYLSNSLIENNIIKRTFAELTPDEVEYTFKTTNGLLWDEICLEHPNLERGEVKEKMFGAVFYSKIPDAERWYKSEYADEFKSKYPSVYKLIDSWKDDKNQDAVKVYMAEHKLPYRENACLPIAMMALESDIFLTILKRLYAKRWNAVHLHDCIVIPVDGNANHPTKEQVKEIMLDVYKEFGLCPTLG